MKMVHVKQYWSFQIKVHFCEVKLNMNDLYISRDILIESVLL